MRRKYGKVKFGQGQDADAMLVKTLVTSFVKYGRITTTYKKAKVLKSTIEKLVEKTKVRTEANKNYLLRFLGNAILVEQMFKNVGPALIKIVGGYVKLTRLHERASDAALMMRIEWAYPVVSEEKVRKVRTVNKLKSDPRGSKEISGTGEKLTKKETEVEVISEGRA